MSLVFENSISPIVTESVAVVPLIPEESVDICLCFRRDVPLSDAANKFVTYVQEHYFTEREQ